MQIFFITTFVAASLLCNALAFVSKFGRVLHRIGASNGASSLQMKLDIEVSSTDGVSNRLCALLAASAIQEINSKGSFYFAIPGGSILKMLGKGEAEGAFAGVDWSKAKMGWVNHRAVPLNDDTSTEFKASDLFLNSWKSKGLKVLSLSGRTDAVEEAKRMELLLAAEVPQGWDMMLIGVGLDGHVGSVYPHSGAVADTRSGVLSVMKPTSSSISLTLPTMLAAKQIVIATAGKSDKYPLGKAEGMFRALEKDDETIESFPAVAFRQSAKWLLDEGAASLLKSL